MKKLVLLVLPLLGLLALPVRAQEGSGEEVIPSTTPIGSPFYRHLAFDTQMDLKELVKFERRGFGRAEIISLILISTSTGQSLKDLGNRRLKENVTLEQLAKEAHLDYRVIYLQARELKHQIEMKGDTNLPPPVFEEKKPDDAKKPKKKKEKDKKEPGAAELNQSTVTVSTTIAN